MKKSKKELGREAVERFVIEAARIQTKVIIEKLHEECWTNELMGFHTLIEVRLNVRTFRQSKPKPTLGEDFYNAN